MTELFSNTLTVCIDAANLSGFLALEPTLALINGSGVDSGWLPLTSPLQRLSSKQPDEPTVDPLAAYKARRARAREQWAQRELERDCERLGIILEAGARRFESSFAGMGMLYLGARGSDIGAYLKSVYRRGFEDDADIGSLDEIAALVDDDAFRAWTDKRGRQALESIQEQLLEAGVFTSPAYVYRGEVFQGRQHLPLLRSHLSRAPANQ